MSSITRRNFLRTGTASAAFAMSPVHSIASILGKKVIKTGYAYDNRFTSYFQNYSELPMRVKWINDEIQQRGLHSSLYSIQPLEGSMDYIKQIHTEEHIKSITDFPVDVTNGATETMGDIAVLALDYVLASVKAVCDGKVKNAFCNIRPPGHHATNWGNSGFCNYANVVIAKNYAQQKCGIERVLIVDWDFHHGNGTVHFVCDDPNTLFFETTSYANSYEDCAKVKLFGNLTNHIFTFALECDDPNERIVSVFENELVTRAAQFKPELVLISSGFDLKKNDALGCFGVTAYGVSQLTRILMDIAGEYAEGRIVSMLEGGYADRDSMGTTFHGLAGCAANHVQTLMTGKVAEETEYYKSTSNTLPNYHLKGRVYLQKLTKLTYQENIQSIAIYSLKGERIAYTQSIPRNFSLQGFVTVPGRYVAEIQTPNGLHKIPFLRN